MEFITNSPAETEKIGAALGQVIPAGSIIAYRGDLGAGKTAFTRGLARGLGAADRVTSPTYTIVNEYLSVPVGRENNCDSASSGERTRNSPNH